MASNPIKLQVRKGDTFLKTVTITYRDTGLPIDLTDAAIVGTIKKHVEDETGFANFEILNRNDINGAFDLVLSATTTATFIVDGYSDSYVFEVNIDFGGSPGFVKTYMYGTLVIGQ